MRSLEGEVRELKDLLDEKDEKIDMLSRIRSSSTSQPIHLPSPRRTSATPSSAASDARGEAQPDKEETFKVQQSPYLHSDGHDNSYFSGTSGGKTVIGMRCSRW